MQTKVLLKKNDDAEIQSGGAPIVGGSLRQVTQGLLVALVVNEINSALIFVAVARSAFSNGRESEGHSALSKAEAIYAQATELARDSCGDKQEAIADSLRELRLAIDALITGESET